MSHGDDFSDIIFSDADQAVQMAKEDWLRAENFFNNAPTDMAEYAVLRLATASKRYEYLLRKRKLMD